MIPSDLVGFSRDLLRDAGQHDQIKLRRAVSGIYYAIFHTLARTAANEFVGPDEAKRDQNAWLRVYRAINHGFVRHQCRDPGLYQFPMDIGNFASFFLAMQIERHAAYYDPSVSFDKAEAQVDMEQADI